MSTVVQTSQTIGNFLPGSRAGGGHNIHSIIPQNTYKITKFSGRVNRKENEKKRRRAAANPSIDRSYHLISFQRLPIIDFGLPLPELAGLINQACRQVGFMYLVNHNVRTTLMDEAFRLTQSFFALSLDQKNKLGMAKSRNGIRGYFSIGEENLGDKNKKHGDQKEGFDIGRDDLCVNDEDLKCPLVDFNQWPTIECNEYNDFSSEEFRRGILAYRSAVLAMAGKLMIAFALGLKLPSDFFTLKAKKPMTTLRLLHYPPQSPKDANTAGCGAHTDYGFFTILNQDHIGGLQVRNVENAWISAPPVPGAFVINVGDMMSRWTNGEYASTVHRVINTTGKERYSLPFFVNPDVDTTVECVPTCLHEDREPLHMPEKSDAILLERYSATFAHIEMDTKKTT